MGIDNNDDIARMFGARMEEKNPKTKVASKYINKDTKIVEMEIEKPNAESLNSGLNNLANIPPLLLIGIVCIIGASFSSYKFLFTLGFILIILALFDKVITKEKKEEMKNKIKSLFKKNDK